MEKLMQRSLSLKLLPVAALLIITPLLSTSLRFKYLYFIVNILVIAVGAEAGLLSFFLQSEENGKPVLMSEIYSVKEEKVSSGKGKSDNIVEKPVKVIENRSSVKVSAAKMEKSRPSIFFIGGGDNAEEVVDDVEGEEGGDHDFSEHELFQKSETFIGNFYKQLKLQRESEP